MKKLLLICVNYNSYDALHAFLASVNSALEPVKGSLAVDIAVADTSDKKQVTNIKPFENIHQTYIHLADNIGYLGAAFRVYNQLAPSYDYVSISNVDLQLAPDFFEQLLSIQDISAGWLAPDIYTEKTGFHENPYMMTRPTRRNFFVWNIIYSRTWIYNIYYRLHVRRRRKMRNYPACEMYAGHGSFMLFTKAFVTHYPCLEYPAFMYGEEIFFAELIRLAYLSVYYTPTLKITNIGQLTTALVDPKVKSQWSKQSLRTLRDIFFRE